MPTRSSRHTKAKHLTANHPSAFRPRGRQEIHLLTNALRLGQVSGIGGCLLSLYPQSAATSPTLRCLSQRDPDRLRVVVPLTDQNGKVFLGTVVEASLNGTCHSTIVPQFVLHRVLL